MKEQHRLYTAGQLAKMYSLKKDTILYYDRIGLFCPEGRAENGYRQYSHSQLTELDAILGMRELGMPIASIRQAITGTDIPSFTALLESERRAVEAKISSLKERSQVLTSMIATIDKACGSPKEVLFFEKRPSCHIVTADIVYEYGMGCEDAWQKAYDHILDKAEQALMPVVGSIIEPQKAVEGRYAKVYATYTRTTGETIPAGEYACMYFQGPVDDMSRQYRHFLAVLADRGVRTTGPFYEELSVSTTVTRKSAEYVTLVFIRTAR